MTDHNNTRFNAEAAAWDSNPDVHRATASALEAILARFPTLAQRSDPEIKKHGPQILEIGCGTGLLSLQIARYAKSLLAVDAASGMVDALRKKLEDKDAPRNVTPLCIMLEDPEDSRLPPAVAADAAVGSGKPSNADGAVPSGSGPPDEEGGPRQKFDIILSHLVLHHIPDLEPLLKTMYGCLKPGGHVALTDFEDFGPEARKFHPEAKMVGVERHGIPAKWFAGLMDDAGFVDVDVKPAWRMMKDVEGYAGEWGQKKPEGRELEKMEFPFLLCVGRRP